ncbi:MAG: hypothetical protein ACKVHO_11645 [Verrucomicrobiia bacterium]
MPLISDPLTVTDKGNGTETGRLRSIDAKSAHTKLFLSVKVNAPPDTGRIFHFPSQDNDCPHGRHLTMLRHYGVRF